MSGGSFDRGYSSLSHDRQTALSRALPAISFRVRITAPTGMRVEALEQRVLKTIDNIKAEIGPDNVEKTLGYAGQQPPMFPISSAFLWTSGPASSGA